MTTVVLIIGGAIWLGGLAMAVNSEAPRLFQVFWLGIGGVAALMFALFLRSYLRIQHSWMRLARFADFNGLRYTHQSAGSPYPGLLFGQSDGVTTAHIWSEEGLFAGAGGYHYTTGMGEKKTTEYWNFIAFRLPREVPHILLDSRPNNRTTQLPASFDRSQRLSLGEPFDSRFQVLAPEGYGQDAFQLLPPDLMELFMTSPADFDFEFVDNWLFGYTKASLDLTRPVVWETIGKFTEGVAARLARVSDHYQDQHGSGSQRSAVASGSNPSRGVKEPGRRLNSSSPLSAVLFIGAVLLVLWVIALLR